MTIRTLIILPQILSRPSGTPLNTMMMCQALRSAGVEVHVLTVAGEQNLEIDGCQIHQLSKLPLVGNLPVGFSLGKIVYNFWIAAILPHMVRRHEIDVIHAIEEAAFYAMPLGRILKKTVVMDLDSDIAMQLRESRSWLAKKLSRSARTLRRFALTRSHVAIAVNPHVFELSKAAAPDVAVHMVHDVALPELTRPPDQRRIEDMRSRLELHGKRLVIYTGNLDGRQGIDQLVEAMALLKHRYHDLKLLIVGGMRQDIEKVRAKIHEMDLEDQVSLTGQFPKNDMPETMALADILISPRQEPFVTPLKIYNYMASDRPIVATALPTHTSVLSEESAELVEPDPAGLAEGIARVLDDPKRAKTLASNAKELLEQKYNFGIFQKRLMAAYSDARNRHLQRTGICNAS